MVALDLPLLAAPSDELGARPVEVAPLLQPVKVHAAADGGGGGGGALRVADAVRDEGSVLGELLVVVAVSCDCSFVCFSISAICCL